MKTILSRIIASHRWFWHFSPIYAGIEYYHEQRGWIYAHHIQDWLSGRVIRVYFTFMRLESRDWCLEVNSVWD